LERRYIEAMRTQRCPFCKHGELDVFDKSPTSATLICPSCHRSIIVKTRGGKIFEVATPALGLITGALAIARFLGLDDLDDFEDWLNR